MLLKGWDSAVTLAMRLFTCAWKRTDTRRRTITVRTALIHLHPHRPKVGLLQPIRRGRLRWRGVLQNALARAPEWARACLCWVRVAALPLAWEAPRPSMNSWQAAGQVYMSMSACGGQTHGAASVLAQGEVSVFLWLCSC